MEKPLQTSNLRFFGKLNLYPPQKCVDKSQKQHFLLELPQETGLASNFVAANSDRKHFLPPVLLTGIAKQQKEDKFHNSGNIPLIGDLSIRVCSRDDKEITFRKCERCQEKDAHIFPILEKSNGIILPLNLKKNGSDVQNPESSFVLIGSERVLFDRGKAMVPLYFRCCPTHHTSKKVENFVKMKVLISCINGYYESDFVIVQWKKGKHGRQIGIKRPFEQTLTPRQLRPSPIFSFRNTSNGFRSFQNSSTISKSENPLLTSPEELQKNYFSSHQRSISSVHSAGYRTNNVSNALSLMPSTVSSREDSRSISSTPDCNGTSSIMNRSASSLKTSGDLISSLKNHSAPNETSYSKFLSLSSPSVTDYIATTPKTNLLNGNNMMSSFLSLPNNQMFHYVNSHFVQPLLEENKRLKDELEATIYRVDLLREENRKLTALETAFSSSSNSSSVVCQHLQDLIRIFQFEAYCTPKFILNRDDLVQPCNSGVSSSSQTSSSEMNSESAYFRKTLVNFLRFQNQIIFSFLKEKDNHWFEPIDKQGIPIYFDGERFGIRIMNRNEFPIYIRLHYVNHCNRSRCIPLSKEDFLKINGCEASEGSWETRYFDLGIAKLPLEFEKDETLETLRLLITNTVVSGNILSQKEDHLSTILVKSFTIRKPTV